MWWWLAVHVAMPFFNGHGYFRHAHGTLAGIFANALNPDFYVERLTNPRTLRYLWQVFFPLGFLAAFMPRYLLPAVPTLAANVLIGGYNIQIGYHYTVSIMPFLFWSAVEGYGRVIGMIPPVALHVKQLMVAGLTGSLLVCCVWAYWDYSVLNIHKLPARLSDVRDSAERRNRLADLSREMGNRGVAATDFLLPHLAHRERIYLFPNPWKVSYWGIAGENPHAVNNVDYIVMTHEDFGAHADLLDYLLGAGIFRQESDRSGMVVLRRVRAESNDRAKSLAAWSRYTETNGLAFSHVAVSPAFQTTEPEFRRLDIDLIEMGKRRPTGWKVAPIKGDGRLIDLDLLGPANNDFKTVYVRATLTLQEASDAILLLGSDDGITVWANGVFVHENIVARAARLGEDSVPVMLAQGENVFIFRVNNIGGAWRLLARLALRFEDSPAPNGLN